MEQQSNHKKKMAKIGAFFLGIILVLTFFSKTFMNMTLPRVRVGTSQSMNLNKKLECQGNVEFQKETPVYAPFESRVLEVYVQVGDRVKEGDKLYKLDTETIMQELQTKQLELKKAQLNLKLLTDQISNINEKLNKTVTKIKEEQAQQSTLSEEKALEIEEAQGLVAVNELLYKDDLISESELRKSQIALEDLLKVQHDEADQKSSEKEVILEGLEEDIENLKEEKREIEGQKELQQLEVEQITLEINELVKKKNNQGIVVANSEGRVLEKEEGDIIGQDERVSENQLLMRLGNIKTGYKIEVEVDSEMDFMSAGDLVELKVEGKNNIEGKIAKIKSEKGKLKVQVTFKTDEISAEDEVVVVFKEDEVIYDNVIPYSAVYKAGNDYFVYVVEEVNDALGKSYIVKKKKVYIQDYNDTHAAISEGITVLDKVVVTSEDEITEGTRVRIENENEVLVNE